MSDLFDIGMPPFLVNDSEPDLNYCMSTGVEVSGYLQYCLVNQNTKGIKNLVDRFTYWNMFLNSEKALLCLWMLKPYRQTYKDFWRLLGVYKYFQESNGHDFRRLSYELLKGITTEQIEDFCKT